MIDPLAVIVPLLAFLGLVTAALIAGGITLAVQLGKWHTDNHLLWLYNRQLIDHIYRGNEPPPPAPPAGLFN